MGWDYTTIPYAAAAWDLPRLSMGHRARAIRILADRHWHLGNQHKSSKVDAALAETVWEGHSLNTNGYVGAIMRQ